MLEPIGQFPLVSRGGRQFIVKFDLEGAVEIQPPPPFRVLLVACREVESRLLEANRMAIYSLPEA